MTCSQWRDIWEAMAPLCFLIFSWRSDHSKVWQLWRSSRRKKKTQGYSEDKQKWICQHCGVGVPSHSNSHNKLCYLRSLWLQVSPGFSYVFWEPCSGFWEIHEQAWPLLPHSVHPQRYSLGPSLGGKLFVDILLMLMMEFICQIICF